jgi:hypothetical protein
VTPSEFWQMHPDEAWWLIDAKRPTGMYGKLTAEEVEECYQEIMEEEELADALSEDDGGG